MTKRRDGRHLAPPHNTAELTTALSVSLYIVCALDKHAG